jgi:hypothetical protein
MMFIVEERTVQPDNWNRWHVIRLTGLGPEDIELGIFHSREEAEAFMIALLPNGVLPPGGDPRTAIVSRTAAILGSAVVSSH